MPDIWMDVDAALTEVPVNIFPLIDDTDFRSIEGAVAYNAGGMTLFWHFVTTAGAYSLTAVTPTTGGNYDWTDQGAAGIYTIEIPASGGASINNDTEGFGWFTGVATGILPWRGPMIGFRAAALNNSMVDGTTIDVNVTAMANGTVTAAAIATGAIDADAIADNAIDAGAIASGAITVDKVADGFITANKIATGAIDADAIADNAIDAGAIATGAITAAKFAAGAIDAAAIAANAIDAATFAADVDAEIATMVWNAATASYGGAGTYGQAVEDGLADTNELQGDWVNGGRLDLLIDGIKTKTDYLPSATAGNAGGVFIAGTNAATTVTTALTTTFTGNLTGSVASVAAGGIAAASFAAGAIDATAIADNAIDAGALAADCITAAKIAAGAIDNATFAADVGSTAYATNIIALAADKAVANAALATASNLADLHTDVGTAITNIGTVDTVVDGLATTLGVAGAGLTAVPWNAAWDAEVQSEVFDALDAAFTDVTALTSNGLLDRIRTLGWILRNKITVTDANGNTVIYKDDSTTAAFTVNAMLTDDSTTTTRLRAA